MYFTWARSLVGRAPALHAGGQEFESPRVHRNRKNFLCPQNLFGRIYT